jgi:manganese transport protein
MGRALVSPRLDNWEMVVVAVGIIGATVMPHNLYLHSALVQTRRIGRDKASVDSALRFNTLDSVVALSVAFLVNAAILTLAALVFHGQTSAMGLDGQLHTFNKDTDWIKEAFQTLSPLMGPAAASMLFAVALLASGQSSTITGTMAGQVVMEGFMRWRVRPWLRRLLTRLVAILPAIFIIGLRRDSSITDLLVLSQVVLALYLPLAMIPLLCFTGSRKLMGRHVNGWFLTIAAWASCLIIIVLDIVSLPKVLEDAWRVIVGA